MKTMPMSCRKFKQKGLTLIEVTVALVVAAVVIGGALALYSQANAQANTNTLTMAVTALRSTVRSGLMASGTFLGSVNSNLIAGKKVPATLTVTGTTIKHFAGGTVDVTGNADGTFSFTLTLIPNSICTDFVANLLTSFNLLQINTATQAATSTFTPALIVTQCSAGPAGSSTVKFTT